MLKTLNIQIISYVLVKVLFACLENCLLAVNDLFVVSSYMMEWIQSVNYFFKILLSSIIFLADNGRGPKRREAF